MSQRCEIEASPKRKGSVARILTGFIGIYQRRAPKIVRERCRFEPSCSNYAQLALERHSITKATRLIFMRLRRCRYPNGGVDYPD
ncbi:MAG: membrane protein insertion efficiency factor YidD [Magnetovibrio sp.]|nr:membrane protein insertion efficiency factor YidD [Magnetovibrio sp.]